MFIWSCTTVVPHLFIFAKNSSLHVFIDTSNLFGTLEYYLCTSKHFSHQPSKIYYIKYLIVLTRKFSYILQGDIWRASHLVFFISSTSQVFANF